MDWCKTSGAGPSSHLPRSSYRLALGTLTDDYRNRISIVGLPDEGPLLANKTEDDTYNNSNNTTDSSDFVLLADSLHGYPVTKIAWEPASALTKSWKGASQELLTTTGDALRIWEYSEGDYKPSSYLGQIAAGPPGRLNQKIALSSVSLLIKLAVKLNHEFVRRKVEKSQSHDSAPYILLLEHD